VGFNNPAANAITDLGRFLIELDHDEFEGEEGGDEEVTVGGEDDVFIAENIEEEEFDKNIDRA
jgi:hypothetical protein